jgi:hypothetical protein
MEMEQGMREVRQLGKQRDALKELLRIVVEGIRASAGQTNGTARVDESTGTVTDASTFSTRTLRKQMTRQRLQQQQQQQQQQQPNASEGDMGSTISQMFSSS